MTEASRDMLKAESAYLAGVQPNLEAAKGKLLTGSIWRTARNDESDRLRGLMAKHRVYDRQRLKELPHNRHVALHGFKRTWWFGKRATGVAIASVLCPLEDLVAGGDAKPGPIDLAELMDHVRRLVSDPSVPHVVGVCAPSGFTKEALQAKLDLPELTLILVEPTSGGGWNVTSEQENLPEDVRAMFDPEANSDKLARVRREIQNRGADLLTGGLSAASLASKLDVPEPVVTEAMKSVAEADPELRISRKSGEALLYRGAAPRAVERSAMNVVDRIRELFSHEGDEAEKINLLAERRAGLAQRRDRLYEDIGQLEAKESDLLTQGRDTQSAVARRRIAAQLAQVRKDIGRQNTTANMLNQQINIVSTDIHNLTLIQQGEMAQLPTTEELTENAVKAEEMLETLKVDADMVSTLETGLSEVVTSDEELAILKEFEGPAPSTEPERSPETAKGSEAEASADSAAGENEAPPRRAEPEST